MKTWPGTLLALGSSFRGPWRYEPMSQSEEDLRRGDYGAWEWSWVLFSAPGQRRMRSDRLRPPGRWHEGPARAALFPLLSDRVADYLWSQGFPGGLGWGIELGRGALGKAWRDLSPEFPPGGVWSPPSTPSWPKGAAGTGSLGSTAPGVMRPPAWPSTRPDTPATRIRRRTLTTFTPYSNSVSIPKAVT